jgi:hypothetical protein
MLNINRLKGPILQQNGNLKGILNKMELQILGEYPNPLSIKKVKNLHDCLKYPNVNRSNLKGHMD